MAQDDTSALIKIKEKSDDDYEKNITYISAGTLVLSLTFVEKIVNLKDSTSVWFLIMSWVFMGATLLVNLVSHQVSSHYAMCCDEEIRLETAELEVFLSRNKKIRNLNWATTGTLALGMLFLIIFCSINAIKMSNKAEKAVVNNSGEKAVVNHPNTEQKGRTVVIPNSLLKPVSDSGSTSSSSNNTNQSSNTQNTNNK